MTESVIIRVERNLASCVVLEAPGTVHGSQLHEPLLERIDQKRSWRAF